FDVFEQLAFQKPDSVTQVKPNGIFFRERERLIRNIDGRNPCVGIFRSQTEGDHPAASANVEDRASWVVDHGMDKLDEFLHFWSRDHRAFVAKKRESAKFYVA